MALMVAGIPHDEFPLLLGDVRRALHLTQKELADVCGRARRTVIRWEAGRSRPYLHDCERIARALYPVDRALAQRFAAEAGRTLEQLGLEKPPPPPAPLPPPEPAPPPHVPAHLADSIVCAAAEAMRVAPTDIRPAITAAFERALALRLGVEAVLDGLRPAERGVDGGAGRSPL